MFFDNLKRTAEGGDRARESDGEREGEREGAEGPTPRPCDGGGDRRREGAAPRVWTRERRILSWRRSLVISIHSIIGNRGGFVVSGDHGGGDVRSFIVVLVFGFHVSVIGEGVSDI